ncbi:septal ring lytic transglycosylase RlpA family protein [Neisseria sp. 74A18]|uniref:septal ring lytic transglycosylase RlpA family protein n=1 Tax=Neisseria sp. 74A18 TaxID=1696094 RepID=UPI0006CAD370|nr:hypothetical protein AKG43_04670 [Neisseria sp. 74A18]
MTQAKRNFFMGTVAALVFGFGTSSVAQADAVVKAEKLSKSANMSYKVAGKRYNPLKKVSSFSQTGSASWYGGQFHGRKTSSGERYNMHAMTAAHKTLPIPSYARVTNLSNGKSVVVRINDRGPFHGSRVVDVSKAAAQKLGFIQHGTAKVRVEQIVPGRDASERFAQQEARNIYVNLKTFNSKAAAQDYLKRSGGHLKSADMNEKVSMVKQGGNYVVRIGPFQRQEHADTAKGRLLTSL